MVKEFKIKEEDKHTSHRFSTHHKSTTLSLRYSDFCYRLRQGVTKLKRQSLENKSKRRMRSELKIRITLKKSKNQGYQNIRDKDFQKKDDQFQMD